MRRERGRLASSHLRPTRVQQSYAILARFRREPRAVRDIGLTRN